MSKKLSFDKIAYETHPVPYERKRELKAKGFKVLDVRFAPASDPLDHDGDGRKGGSPKPEGGDELNAARAKYLEVIGKHPFHGWHVGTLNAKISEAGQPDEETAAKSVPTSKRCKSSSTRPAVSRSLPPCVIWPGTSACEQCRQHGEGACLLTMLIPTFTLQV